MEKPYSLSISEAEARIRSGELSPLDLAKSLFDRIEAVEPRVKAFVTIAKDKTLELAEIAEREAKKGKFQGPLHGIPLGIKDIINTQGIHTKSGSIIREDFIPLEDAEVVRSLKSAGAIVLGKTVTHEWAFEVFCPPTRNPWDLERIAGGSSGGSAAAVAAEMCPGALGTDSGGSLRIPSSLCGIVGLKPTYGLVSNHGITTVSWTLDHVGPMTRTVQDSALLLSVLALNNDDSVSLQSRRPGSLKEEKDYTRNLLKGVDQPQCAHRCLLPRTKRPRPPAGLITATMTIGPVLHPSVPSPPLALSGRRLSGHILARPCLPAVQ